jgi:hypothetical protein
MQRVVFYSWQSDLPNPANRGLIQSALEAAAEKITADDSIAVEPVIDRDTQGVPGSPDIASTIFAKISAADLFVGDVSIVAGQPGHRRAPNPNVLIELGYALKALGSERVILVFNKFYGDLNELPFDLRTRRILVYEMPEVAERAPERKRLAEQFEAALRAAMGSLPPKEVPAPISGPAIKAIEDAVANRRMLLRRALEGILNTIEGLEPKKHRDGGTAQDLIEGIRRTDTVVGEFSRICEAIALMDDAESAIELYRWFGKLFERYDAPQGYTGPITNADQDYFKFLGHELFVINIALLIREDRWELAKRLLDEPIPVRRRGRSQSVGWQVASEHLALLIDESAKQRRLSLHSDLINELHSQGGALAGALSMQDFMDADFFLFLLSVTPNDASHWPWRAWSCLYLKQPPTLVQRSEHLRFAKRVVMALGLADIDDFRKLLMERGPDIRRLFNRGYWSYPIDKEDIDRIGTR